MKKQNTGELKLVSVEALPDGSSIHNYCLDGRVGRVICRADPRIINGKFDPNNEEVQRMADIACDIQYNAMRRMLAEEKRKVRQEVNSHESQLLQ